jgi:diaminopimelate decarboxylase
MQTHPDADSQREVLQKALRSGFMGEEDTSVVFYNLDELDSRLQEIESLFPPASLHTVALKANPLPSILERVRQAGFGAEAASHGELTIAHRSGFPAERIVFDSPVKTENELRAALELGVHINADSIAELERIAALLGTTRPKGTIGIRLNPQVGEGTIESTSVGGRYSKFGVALKENREALREAFRRFPWLTAVHVHVGSQGCPLELLLEGARAVTDFAVETNGLLDRAAAPARRITHVDIGGGLPVTYRVDAPAPHLREYIEGLKRACPALFTGTFRLITEFGRYVHARSGWAASRVEYVKHGASGNTLLVHLGADMFLRRCYDPARWYHSLSLIDAEGNPKSGPVLPYSVGGPLCFGGDMLARQLPLPHARAGDYLLIHDAGAYTLSMWSRYNSRQLPKVLGYDKREGLRLLKERESLDEVWHFWTSSGSVRVPR